jgi:hypothetical protein
MFRMSNQNSKAYWIGAAIASTVPAVAAFNLALETDWSWLIVSVFYGALLSAGVVTAYVSTSRKVLLACLLSVPFGCSMVVANTMHHLLGFPTDTPGVYGAIVVASIFFPLGFIVCGLGGLLVWCVARSKHNKPLQPIARENARSG